MITIQENVALAPYTTFGVGGPARYFVEAASSADIRDALAFARERSLRPFVLGGGSNLLVSDRGFDGLVIKVAVGGFDQRADDRHIAITAGAGEPWDELVARSVAQNCGGLECLSGIPGSVGGAPVQNIGAYGQEVSQTIVSVDAVGIASGELRTFTSEDCAFSYRRSIFNTTQSGSWIITSVTFRLQRDASPALAYRDLQNHFAGRQPTLAEVRDGVIAIRSSKGMVVRENDPDARSAGSFFKNPVLDEPSFAALAERLRARGLTMPSYPALDSQRKVPAAWLVENSGFPKGYSLGRAGISTKHALALVNRGGATAADIIALKHSIQKAVNREFGIELEAEPVMLGV